MLFGSWCICTSLIFAIADTLLASDVSALSWYSLSQILFWHLMYLQDLDIYCCRCSFWDQHICNLLFFELADAFQPAWHVNCIYILLFLNLKILPSQIFHLHPTFSIPCRCFSLKLYIFNLLFLCFADTSHPNFASSIPQNPLSQIPSSNILRVLFTSWTELQSSHMDLQLYFPVNQLLLSH